MADDAMPWVLLLNSYFTRRFLFKKSKSTVVQSGWSCLFVSIVMIRSRISVVEWLVGFPAKASCKRE